MVVDQQAGETESVSRVDIKPRPANEPPARL
jgi:hypothetical protein